MYIGIVADDLTGAADSVAPFAGAGMRAAVWLAHDGSTRLPAYDAVALVTGSRDARLSRDQRDAIVRESVRLLRSQRPEILYQKIDSTLRGDVTGEMAAFRGEVPRRIAVICPAFPANGRTVTGGRLYVHGEPWPPTAPASLRSDGTLLGIVCPDPASGCAHITLEEIRGGPEQGRDRLHALISRGVTTITCDAVTNEDLETLTRATLPDATDYLFVGSGGWTGAMARHRGAKPQSPVETGIFASGRVLVVIGSRHTVSRRQARTLCEQAGREPIAIHHGPEAGEAADLALRQFSEGCRVVVAQSPDLDLADAREPAISAFAEEIRRAAGSGTRIFDAVIVTGGNTALQLCRGFGVSGLEITGELAPGVVVARTIADNEQGAAFDNLPMILKSGGFGATDLIASCVGGTGPQL